MTVVLLHGFLGRPAAWEPVIAALGDGAGAFTRSERQLELVAPALPGHGPSPFVPATDRFETAVERFAETLPGGPLVLAGYSMGGRIAIALSVLLGERVRGLLLVGADFGLRDPDARAARARWDDEQAATIEALGVERFASAWERLPLFASQRALPAEVRVRQQALRTELEAAGLAWAMRTLGLGRMPSHWDSLPGFARPLRVLTGSVDSKFTAIAREAAALAPDARHRVVEGAGHNLLLERPAAVAGELMSLLEA